MIIRDSLLGSLLNERLVSEGLATCVPGVPNSRHSGADTGVEDELTQDQVTSEKKLYLLLLSGVVKLYQKINFIGYTVKKFTLSKKKFYYVFLLFSCFSHYHFICVVEIRYLNHALPS